MSNFNHWVTSSEMHEEPPLGAYGDEIGEAVDDLTYYQPMSDALEAYHDLVMTQRKLGKSISNELAKAIYIGMEQHGIRTSKMPSLESYGGRTVSLELLDKIKEGASWVADKIKQLYEYIVGLIKKFFGLFGKKSEALEKKVDDLEERFEETKDVPESNEKIEIKNPTLLYSGDKFIGQDASVLPRLFDETDGMVSTYFESARNALNKLFSDEAKPSAARNEQNLQAFLKLTGGIFVQDKNDENRYNSKPAGFSSYEFYLKKTEGGKTSPVKSFNVFFKAAAVEDSEDKIELDGDIDEKIIRVLRDYANNIAKYVDNGEDDLEKIASNYRDGKKPNDFYRFIFITDNYIKVKLSYYTYLIDVTEQLARVVDAVLEAKASKTTESKEEDEDE